MGGFPTRTNRAGFGPSMENESPVNNPKRELSGPQMNINFWNLAGCGLVIPKAVFRCTISATTITTANQLWAFDPDSSQSTLTMTYQQAGHYNFVFASQYPDEMATDINLSLIGGMASHSNLVTYSSTHDGGNNVAVLTDSTQAWTVNALVGQIVYNVTDGSSSTITANTATTVTGVLSGGTDDDWDTSDEYRIGHLPARGYASMTSGFVGDVMFFNTSNALIDVHEFMLFLW